MKAVKCVITAIMQNTQSHTNRGEVIEDDFLGVNEIEMMHFYSSFYLSHLHNVK